VMRNESLGRDEGAGGNSQDTARMGQSMPFAAARQADEREADLRFYLDTCCRDIEGWLHVGIGYRPFVNAAGKYRHAEFVPGAVRWPDEANGTIALLLAESEHADVWVCPYLMTHGVIRTKDGKRKTGRAKGQAVSRRTVHSDIDREPFDSAKAEKLAAMGGFAIASGSPGNAHVYVPLSAPVSVDQHEALCVALGKYIGGADPGKHSDNDLLRPPGTLNHKPTVLCAEPPARVRWWS
jgi:hypothetical protein